MCHLCANSFETMLMHQEDEPPELEDMPGNAQFSPAINLVIAKCLAKLPQREIVINRLRNLHLILVRVKEGRDLLAYSKNYPQKGGNCW